MFRFFRLFGLAALVVATCAAKPSPTRYPAVYLVFETTADGFRLVHRSEVTLAAPLASLSELELRDAERAGRGVSVVLRDARRGVVFRQHVEPAEWIRGEFHGQPEGRGWRIEAHAVPDPEPAFAVRVPAGVGRELRLHGRGRASSVDLAAPAPAAEGAAPAALLPASPGGSPANRLDVLLIGDGYTTEQQAVFEADADVAERSLLGISPHSEYRNYVNFHRLFVASPQPGADHPPYDGACAPTDPGCCADPTAQADPLSGTFVDTAFDARFCLFGIHRLLVVDDGAVWAAASAVPDADRILVIVNDATYGGSGGAVGVFSTNPSSGEIARHEFGHSFTALADEYESPYPGFPGCSDLGGFTPCEANVTDASTPGALKWLPWVDPATPIPTPVDDPAYSDALGLFEGARYLTTGMYRPRRDCLMRVLGVPFCEVCSESYVLRLYRGGWGMPTGGIDPIEPGSESPAPGAVTAPPCELPFSFELLEPEAGPPAQVTWRVDGVPVPGARESLLFLPDRSGTFAVELETRDVTPLVHPAVAAADLTSGRSWAVEVAAGSCPARCSDGADDDGDGAADHPADAGCGSPGDPDERSMHRECDDGVDDDGDGRADYRLVDGDPGCASSSDGDERSARQCDNGSDDDGDGLVDWRSDGTGDPHCSGLTDDREAPGGGGGFGCGLGPELALPLALLRALRSARRPGSA